MQRDLKSICESVVELARSTGSYIRNERKGFTPEMVEVKGLHNYISHVDTSAERMIVDKLKEIFPAAGFIAEEGSGDQNPDGTNWIIDPLDGTTNFIHGLPPYAVSIALTLEHKLVLGVVYEVALNECFYSWGQNKAFLNGEPIQVSNTLKVSDSLIATGFPYYDYGLLEQFMGTMEYFMRHSHGLRRIGSAATDLAYVACGRFDAFYEYGLNPWDVAAGVFIIQQAGGIASDFTRNDKYLFGREVIATNGMIYDEFQSIVAKFMVKDK